MAEPLTTLRINKRTKWLAQTVARALSMTFAELVELLLNDFLETATLSEGNNETLVRNLAAEVWSEHPADRIALLGNRLPHALTERERTLWQRIICELPRYWKVQLTGERIPVSDRTFHFANFRADFPLFEDESVSELIAVGNELRKQSENAKAWFNSKPNDLRKDTRDERDE